MNTICGLTAGEIRQRADKWFDWDEVRLICAERCFPLALGFNAHEGYDWTDVADFRRLLEEMGDEELLRFRQNGRSVVVVDIDDEGEPFLVVEEV
jgi:hypothetical protein